MISLAIVLGIVLPIGIEDEDKDETDDWGIIGIFSDGKSSNNDSNGVWLCKDTGTGGGAGIILWRILSGLLLLFEVIFSDDLKASIVSVSNLGLFRFCWYVY